MKTEVMYSLFGMSSSLVIILFNDNARPHVFGMTLQKVTDSGWDFVTSTICSWSFTHWLPFFSSIWTEFHDKKILFQRIIRNYIWRFLDTKIFIVLSFWHKKPCLSMAEIHICSVIIFWLIKTLFKFISSEINIYSKIRFYFLKNLIAS